MKQFTSSRGKDKVKDNKKYGKYLLPSTLYCTRVGVLSSTGADADSFADAIAYTSYCTRND